MPKPKYESTLDPMLYKVADAVRLTSLSQATIYRMMEAGELETVKIGQSRLIRSESLLELIANGSEVTSATAGAA